MGNRLTQDPAPILTSPGNGDVLTDPRPAFDWEPVAGATSYTLHVSTNGTFSKLLIKVTVAGTAFGAPANLPLGKVLDRRVQANSINGPSAWSGVWSFLIVP